MNNSLLEKLINLFSYDNSLITENFNEVKISLKATAYKELDSQTFAGEVAFVNDRDKLQISFLIGDNDPIDYYSPDPVEEFLETLARGITNREDEPIEINITLSKSQINGRLSIYSLTHFQAFLEKLSLYNVLSQFNEFLRNTSNIILENQTTGPLIRTGSVLLTNKGDQGSLAFIDRAKIIGMAKTGGYSNYFTDFELIPDDFLIHGKSRNGLENIFNRLATIGSMAYLFDNFTIQDSTIHFKLNGYKSIEGVVEFSEIKADSSQQYENIYSWVYNSGNFTDKLGLARNIISLHLNPVTNLTLGGFPYSSLFSAYKVYEKENINQYISIRNSLSDQLLNFHDRANLLAESFAGNLQKSGLALISFYISVIVLKVLSKDKLLNVFTFDTSIFSTVILICSAFYFWFSRWDLIKQKERFSGRYFDLKRRYMDLLNRQDIDRILNNDREYSQDMDFINAKLKVYSGMWIAFLVLMLASTWFLYFWYN